ncbi:unnamed protein product [Cuscuta epithymum]|uniref:Uncharacterized protein n=1 Tax=Cuscuta epithymum TaxID=186058 RepID=A0AAV0D3Y7_9ASTE|nr:unnamed protein product [Cuscuta epithymum]CAH9123222.1 unnamed protein product [Cuscuta epithymum]
MTMLCFVLDLRCISTSLLHDLKQLLLQLANLHAISSSASNGSPSKPKPLPDQIGLCYIFKNRISCAHELKVAYSPRGHFNLRDFHHAVNSLPVDAFGPDFNNSSSFCGVDMKLSDVLSDEVLYSWGSQQKDITKKVVLISSCVLESLDSTTRMALTGAAEKCVSVEFVFLEQTSSHLADIPENINNFLKEIGDLENCIFEHRIQDARVFFGLVMKWSQELKDDMEEPLQAHFIFKNNLVGSSNKILCNVSTPVNQIIDEFSSCETCRCHGMPLDDSKRKESNVKYYCPVTGDELVILNIIENSVKIGENITLYLPSFHPCQDTPRVSSPVEFNVIKRTGLHSLNEGIIFGSSFIITPAFLESDETENSDLYCKVFQVMSSLLNSLDQGIVCSSNYNIDTARQSSFLCYYLLLPSEKGTMLLRRLAGSEEILPVPEVMPFKHMKVANDIENSVQASLFKMEVSDYDPFHHERGFHKKLNTLVKESLQFGAMPPRDKDVATVLNSQQQDTPAEASQSTKATKGKMIEENISVFDIGVGDITSELIAEEWEKLIVTREPKICSPSCNPNPKFETLILSTPQDSRQLDEKTSRILERLEIPKQLKRKTASPVTSSSVPMIMDSCGFIKKPLVPYGSSVGQSITSSQPIKPNFQKHRKKK